MEAIPMARRIFLGLATCFVAAVLSNLPSATTGQSAQSPTYTIETREHGSSLETGVALEFEKTYARRGDGSTVRVDWHRLSTNTRHAKRTIHFVPDRKTVTVTEYIQATTTVYWGPHNVPPLWPPSGPDFVRVGTDTLLGVDVVKSVRDDKVMKITRWRAPQFNDFIFKEILERKAPDGTISSVGEQTVLKATQGEPDPALFTIPDNFTEMSPSQADSETVKRFYNGEGGLDADLLERSDRMYYASQAYKPR
jgi:hypothetical protein